MKNEKKLDLILDKLNDEEQIELIIEELNAGVDDDESLIIFRPDLAYVPFTQDNKINFIHLN